MRRGSWFALIGLCPSLLLLLAGCAGNLDNGSANSDSDRNSGFYGGITGGGSRL
jgi:hypothetical protein